MLDTGLQYIKDDVIDSSGFLRRARKHQSQFRVDYLGLGYDGYGNYLTEEDAKEGHNFYDGFGIFDAVKKRYNNKYSKPLCANMLRSEHIPFNFFIPFNKGGSSNTYLKNVLNDFFNDSIRSTDDIKIEYAPSPKEHYLNDATSFDAYIEYTHRDGAKGIIGIEVKYTEKEYKLKLNSSEADKCNTATSSYHLTTKASNLYKPGSVETLKTDKFRQIWRNHILGESILLKHPEYKHFTSLTLFPEGNVHFVEASREYIDKLANNENKFLAVTYEEFFSSCKKYCPNEEYNKWLNYLTERYIVT
ncbi:MAG: hypothetical protein K0S09_731 [Sphingobacteriaceae bacterium]|jgi:hypothetical protein|nr:hypothetical protein [Sphingobacteriaceae bacterium]